MLRLEKVKKNSRKNLLNNIKDWYKIEKRILQKFSIRIYLKSKINACRIYQFYNYAKGDWKEPITHAFSKISKAKFKSLCIEKILNKES